jgi:hypothetical protein
MKSSCHAPVCRFLGGQRCGTICSPTVKRSLIAQCCQGNADFLRLHTCRVVPQQVARARTPVKLAARAEVAVQQVPPCSKPGMELMLYQVMTADV